MLNDFDEIHAWLCNLLTILVDVVQVPDHLEPGLNDKQLTRLLGLDIRWAEPSTQTTATVTPPRPRKKSGVMDLSPEEIKEQLEKQRSNKWDAMVQGNLILKQGLIDKRKVSSTDRWDIEKKQKNKSVARKFVWMLLIRLCVCSFYRDYFHDDGCYC